MARINIENSWWTDPRRGLLAKLCGCQDVADGVVIKLWRTSQHYWSSEKSLIPKEVFESLSRHKELVAAHLAFVEGDFVYAKGTREHHQWLLSRVENGKKGGLAKASKHVANSSERLANASESCPPTPTPTLTPTKKKNICSPSASEFDFLSIYKKYPLKKGKSVGLKKLKSQIKTKEHFEKLEKAMGRFLEHQRKKKTEKGFYPHFSTFVSHWEDWLDSDAGDFVATTSVSQVIDPEIRALNEKYGHKT